MNGQRYLCNYEKYWKKDFYCDFFIKRYAITNDDDIERCCGLITLGIAYATEMKCITNVQKRNRLLYKISVVDGELRKLILNVVNARVERRG